MRGMTSSLPSALDHVQKIVSPGCKLAVFLDYDGTLSPIAGRPEDAILSDSMRDVLKTLTMLVPVSVLSGRNLDDVRRRVNIDGIVYAGSHGFDIMGPHGLGKEMGAELLPIIDLAENELREELAGICGALVERKRFSVAAHYRQANESDARRIRQAAENIAAQHRELRAIEGRKVRELQPNIDWNKGRALIWVLEAQGLDREEILPLCLGDDLTDEDAFRAIQQRGVGILVSDQLRPTAASYRLKDPAEVECFLRGLIAVYR